MRRFTSERERESWEGKACKVQSALSAMLGIDTCNLRVGFHRPSELRSLTYNSSMMAVVLLLREVTPGPGEMSSLRFPDIQE